MAFTQGEMAVRIWKAFTENSAETRDDAGDPKLRGRTYHVPYATVWDQIVEMIRDHPRWRLLHADEFSGIIRAEASIRWLRMTDDVRVRVALDENALTRVDMRSASRSGRADLGVNARRIARFFRRLDRHLGVNDR